MLPKINKLFIILSAFGNLNKTGNLQTLDISGYSELYQLKIKSDFTGSTKIIVNSNIKYLKTPNLDFIVSKNKLSPRILHLMHSNNLEKSIDFDSLVAFTVLTSQTPLILHSAEKLSFLNCYEVKTYPPNLKFLSVNKTNSKIEDCKNLLFLSVNCEHKDYFFPPNIKYLVMSEYYIHKYNLLTIPKSVKYLFLDLDGDFPENIEKLNVDLLIVNTKKYKKIFNELNIPYKIIYTDDEDSSVFINMMEKMFNNIPSNYTEKTMENKIKNLFEKPVSRKKYNNMLINNVYDYLV